MPAPKKGMGLLLLGKPGPVEESEEPGESSARLAAQGILDAVADGDVAALEEALSTFLDARGTGNALED